jgi:ribonuclease P protein subunit POP4
MITPYNILRHELSGLAVEAITRDGHKVSGTIIDETRETIKIETSRGKKTTEKKNATYTIYTPGKAIVKIEGILLLGRPEDRIKKKHRIKFI